MNQDFNELKKNTTIIAIANLGSKIISFILAPLYSYYMTVSEYGTMDVINSTISLLMPFICFDVYESTFRYSSDTSYEKKKVLSSSLIICLPGLVISVAISIIAVVVLQFHNIYLLISLICICLGAINSIMAQFLRGTNCMKLFAGAGIVSTVGLLIFDFIFLILLNKGLEGWLIAFLLSRLLETIYLISSCKITQNFSLHFVERKYIQEFVKFALPLMPTTIMWWIMNLSDRYMLAGFIGVAATGIYSVSSKIPNLLSVFENIFYQAWQTTAINKYKDQNRDVIFTAVFNNYLAVMVIGVLALLIISKPIILFLFEQDYISAWKYIPLLIFGVVVHALNGNLGSLYSVFKSTKGAFYSTFLGAITNIILNIIFIPIMGIMGAALTTLVGYIVTYIYRWFDTKRFVCIQICLKEVSIFLMMIIVQTILFYINGIWSYVVRCLIFLMLVIWKKELLLKIVKR